MKTSKIILIALLALPSLSFAKDEPKFSSGFSSGKSTATTKHQPSSATPKPVKGEVDAAKQSSSTNVGTTKSSFGSFGGAKTAKATSVPASSATTPAAASTNSVTPVKAKSTSALTQSLEKSAAQSNALKALDARNAQKTTGGMAANVPPSTNVSPPIPVAPNPIAQPMPPQVVYQNAPSGGWNSGILGFLLGNSMSHNDRPYNVHNGYNQPNISNANSTTDIAGKESTGTSFLRIVVWLLILGGIGGVIWYFVRRSSANDAAAAAKRNYSL